MPQLSPSLWLDPAALLSAKLDGRKVADAPALSHAQFAARSLRLAAGLRARGIDHAALRFDDAAEMGVAICACWRAGVTAILPGSVLEDACARVDEQAQLWLTDTQLPGGRGESIDSLLGADELPPAPLDESAVGIVLYTSGSSGAPKRIAKRWSQLAGEVRALARQWPAQEALTVLGSVDVHHMFGLPFRVLWPLCAGHALDRLQHHYPEELERASLAHRRFIWIASPALLRRVESRVDWQGLRDRLTALYTAGGPLPVDVSDAIAAESGCRPTEIYGSSETGVVAFRHGGAPWRTLGDTEIGLDDEGALWARSSWTAEGQREQTADAAEPVPGGFVLKGRIDRIVKLEEKRIGLPDVEAVLQQHPWVAEARAGLAQGQPRLAALIGLSPAGLHALRNGGRRAFAQSLRQHMEGRLEPLAQPRVWRLMRRIPWNAQGKLPQREFDALAGPRPKSPVFADWTQPEPACWQARFEVPADLAFFPGHFPATPVVPGVAQISWAVDAGAGLLGAPLPVIGIENLKFQRLMRPGDQATLELRWDAARAKLLFAYQMDGEPCSSGRIVTEPAHA